MKKRVVKNNNHFILTVVLLLAAAMFFGSDFNVITGMPVVTSTSSYFDNCKSGGTLLTVDQTVVDENGNEVSSDSNSFNLDPTPSSNTGTPQAGNVNRVGRVTGDGTYYMKDNSNMNIQWSAFGNRLDIDVSISSDGTATVTDRDTGDSVEVPVTENPPGSGNFEGEYESTDDETGETTNTKFKWKCKDGQIVKKEGESK